MDIVTSGGVAFWDNDSKGVEFSFSTGRVSGENVETVTIIVSEGMDDTENGWLTCFCTATLRYLGSEGRFESTCVGIVRLLPRGGPNSRVFTGLGSPKLLDIGLGFLTSDTICITFGTLRDIERNPGLEIMLEVI